VLLLLDHGLAGTSPVRGISQRPAGGARAHVFQQPDGEPDILAIVLTKTVGTAPTVCAATQAITIFPDTAVDYCYTVHNTGNVTLTIHDLVDNVFGVLTTSMVYSLAPGASTYFTYTTVVTITTTNVATWTAYVSTTLAATAVASATVGVEPFHPSIVATTTVGITPGVCANTRDLIVPSGIRVYYCYTIQNTGAITLPFHGLYDSELGTLFTGLAYTLTPGARVSTLQMGMEFSTTITATTTNLAIWDAYVDAVHTVVVTATARVTLGNAAVVVTKTVSIDPLTCGAASLIVVKPGTPVYFCAWIWNTGGITLTNYTVTDLCVGYAKALVYLLPPGAAAAFGRSVLVDWPPFNALQDMTSTVVVTATSVAPGAGGQTPAGAFVASGRGTAYVLIDTDDDSIPDVVEGNADADADGLPNRLDPDADNDEFTDREEAGPDPLHPRAAGCLQMPDYLNPAVPTPGTPHGAPVAIQRCDFLPLLRR